MENVSSQRAKDIFSDALETPIDERSAFLQSACGLDEKLLTQVRGLLAAHEEAGEFLSSPTQGNNGAILAIETVERERLTEGPGAIIGRYKLLQRIGEGGFGVVYMAEQQEPIRRKVALKIIKLGMDTGQVIARFEAERQALALMDHPNIANVLDAGATEAGRPYFVMELVKGIPITEYCDTNSLSTRERLELFTRVCHAVQHAHQKGIIHRDLKPRNILVTLHDGRPVPKVIDFGVAKATQQRLTEKTMFTELGQFIGTPAYMSPEQAELSGLDVDTRSDIYSLGVLLYELLTGRTPFDPNRLRSAGFNEMQRIIREEEPAKPSTRLSTLGDTLTEVAKHRRSDPQALTKLVRGDLDWIVMKALEKDRTRRYETANEFAKDIVRHLAQEPVAAGPPSATYKLRKFIKRNRGVVTAGSLVAVALMLGAMGSFLAYRVGATTFTMPSDREIVMTRVVDAPRSLVFDAWTNPKHVPHWFGRSGWTLPVCEIDFRAGGVWRFVMRDPNGTDVGMRGVYQEITPPERLVYSESFDGYPGETLNTLILTEKDGKTTITCRVLYPSKEVRDIVIETGMKEGASETFDRLAEYLRTIP